MPDGSSWMQLYGVAVLCGIGFTMSLFIGMLSFSSPHLQDVTKVGVIIGSGVSAIFGWFILRTAKTTFTI